MPEDHPSNRVKVLGRLVGIGLAAGLIATPILAEQQDRLPRECRQEIRKLCGTDRSKIRQCLRERFSELSEPCAEAVRSRVAERREGQRRDQAAPQTPYQAPARITGSVIFGEHPRQKINIYAPEDAVDDLPVILFVHGGGWSMGDNRYVQSKPAYFTASNYIFASTGYRLVPSATVEQQAQDVGAAVAALVGQASSISVDPERIVLMGHSAGAHLAALVGTDPQYAGDAFGAIKGVILLDGAGYDVAATMADAGPRRWQIYNQAFSSDPERQAALSPMTHVGGEDAPNWLALHVAERGASKEQSQALAKALNAQGASAEAVAITDTDHSRMTREMGTPSGTAQTEAVDEFLKALFKQP